MLIKLSPKEMSQCNQAATMRWQLARASGVKNQRRDQGRSDADLDLLGVKAEVAVSKVFNIPHQHAICVDDGCDLWLEDISVDVKATFHKKGRLLFKRKDAFKADCAVLVCQIEPDRLKVAGYASQATFMEKAQEIDLGHGKGWAMDQDQLNSLERLWYAARQSGLKF
jgi:hypothetical protein